MASDAMRLAKNQTEIDKLHENEQKLAEQQQVKAELAMVARELNAHEQARPATWESIGKEREEITAIAIPFSNKEPVKRVLKRWKVSLIP